MRCVCHGPRLIYEIAPSAPARRQNMIYVDDETLAFSIVQSIGRPAPDEQSFTEYPAVKPQLGSKFELGGNTDPKNFLHVLGSVALPNQQCLGVPRLAEIRQHIVEPLRDMPVVAPGKLLDRN